VDEPLTDRLKGGVIIAVISLLLVLATFYISNPTVPRVMAILTGVVGVAVIAGLVPVRGPQDFYGGLALRERLILNVYNLLCEIFPTRSFSMLCIPGIREFPLLCLTNLN